MLAALLAGAAAEPVIPPEQRLAADRFIAACVNGELTSAGIRQIAASDIPSALRRRIRGRQGQYYRFDDRRSSFLIVTRDSRPSAEYSSICTLATRAGDPMLLHMTVMHSLRPDTRPPPFPLRRPPGSRTLSTSVHNSEGGYTIQAVRVGGYTLLETLQFRVKSDLATAPCQSR